MSMHEICGHLSLRAKQGLGRGASCGGAGGSRGGGRTSSCPKDGGKANGRSRGMGRARGGRIGSAGGGSAEDESGEGLEETFEDGLGREEAALEAINEETGCEEQENNGAMRDLVEGGLELGGFGDARFRDGLYQYCVSVPILHCLILLISARDMTQRLRQVV